MAYAEKRGKSPRPWRVKYRAPDGSEVSESGFETKNSALTFGRDQEARIREGRWTDPAGGKISVGEWMDRWMAIQDIGISTQSNREYQIRRFLRPAWGTHPLDSLSTEQIAQWETSLPATTGICRRTARDLRGLLGTILGDAASTRPPLIPHNPALRPRNRSRRTGRRLERRTPVWEPCLPVDLPKFPDELLARQVRHHPYGKCACITIHGGSGRYLFLSPDGRHYWRSN